MAFSCGLEFSQHANWILSDSSRVSIPEGKKQKFPALNFNVRPGIDCYFGRFLLEVTEPVRVKERGKLGLPIGRDSGPL